MILNGMRNIHALMKNHPYIIYKQENIQEPFSISNFRRYAQTKN